MSEQRPLHELLQAPRPARRRTAPALVEASDVWRFRGMLVACGAAAAAVVVLLIASEGWGALSSPGPQSRPHREAGLECGACHRDDVQPARACANCHGRHQSQRPEHRRLAAAGKLPCTSCHAIHRRDEGVSFVADGRVIRYGTGFDQALDIELGFLPERTLSVPLVPAQACGRCHDLASQRDPIAACLVNGNANAPSVCFDEHRTIATIAGAGAKVAPGAHTERDAAWEAAREVAALGPVTSRGTGLGSALGVVGIGLLLGLVVLGVPRGLARLRRWRALKREAEVARAAPVVRLPQIDENTCLGCYACVDACPYDVLEIKRYVAVVARPDDCCGLTLCEQRCPNGSLVITDGEPIFDRLEVDDALQSKALEGIYLAGDLTGLPLIKNAINQGAHAARAVADSLRSETLARDGQVRDLVIVGAGPAGISAALEAKAKKLDAVTLEQSSVAASIKSFPRGKLVFDQPLGVPVVGELWLEEATKEELLAKWLRIVRKERLDVREGVRVTGVERQPKGRFCVQTVDPEGRSGEVLARRVILAIGKRGSPKRLAVEIDEAFENRVHYHLADARSFAAQRVLVVGLGDSAMEAAIALCHQPDTVVTMSYRGAEFRRGKARNIAEVRRLEAAGRLSIAWESEVARVASSAVELNTPKGQVSVECDAVFVLIGGVLPWEFLRRIGLSPAHSGGGGRSDG